MCDEKAWQKVLDHTSQNYTYGISSGVSREIFGLTDLKGRLTYIRGWQITHPQFADAPPRTFVVHELMHIYLQSRDENQVDQMTTTIMNAIEPTLSPSFVAVAKR